MGSNLVKLRDKIETTGLRAVLISNLTNIRYLTGFTGTSAMLLVADDDNFLFTDFRYIEQAQKQSPEVSVVEVKNTQYMQIKEYLGKRHIDSVGFESESISYHKYNELQNALKLRLVPLKGLVEQLRAVKQENEIALMRKAAAIADTSFEFILNKIKPGITERQLALQLEFFMKQNGAETLSFETIIASGERSAMPHGTASDRILANHDLVILDFGCIYKGYCSDMTRTVVVGRPSEKQKRVYEVVLRSQENALEKLRAKMTCDTADRLARQIIEDAGFGDCFGHGLGHGLGLEIHEQPRLAPRVFEKLETGMAVTVEPGIYIQGFGGVRIEDLVVIRDDGTENLTRSPKQLISI